MLQIRPAQRRDIPGLLRLLAQVNLVHHRGRPDLFRAATKYGEAELARMLDRPEEVTIFVAEESGDVLGHAFCMLQEVRGDRLLEDRRTLYVDDICVDENCRGRGVGRALYRHVLAWAKEQGCYNLTLNVWACNPGALEFYRRCGLEVQKYGMETLL
ncbi:MAG: GNAT family N-acetyltransferase [Oscillospiraceae bacterium]|nr:GNAT family N-acetyltransferase [Oscillospiraceae bacterium]